MIRNVLILICAILIMLAIVEGVLRIFEIPKRPPIGWRWQESPYKGSTIKDNQVNQLQLRGKTIAYNDDDVVILLVGDSQVEAGAHPADNMPEVLLQSALKQELGMNKVKVFSVASAGWGQDQELLAMREYLSRFRADLILVWLSPSNDYWENTFVDRSVTMETGKLKPTFITAGTRVSLGFPDPSRVRLLELTSFAFGRMKQGKEYPLTRLYAEQWDEKLPLPTLTVARADSCPTDEVPWPELREAFFNGKRQFTAVTDDRLEQGRSRFSPFMANRSPRDEYMIKLTHALLGQIVAEGEGSGTAVRFFYPYRSDLDQIFREVKCVKSKTSGKYYAYDGSDFLRYLKDSPLTGRILSIEMVGANFAISNADWHLNADGNIRAMRLLAQNIMSDKALRETILVKQQSGSVGR